MRFVAILVLVLLAAVPAVAATPRTSVAEVERDVLCTTCGVPLALAESPAADSQRAWIARMVAAGLTKRQIEDRLVAVYGERVLLNPRGRSGTSLAAWVLPGAAILAAIALLIAITLRWRRRPSAAVGNGGEAADAGEPPALDPADAARIDAELTRLGR